MIESLMCHRRSHAQDRCATDERLKREPGVEPAGIERFDVRFASGPEHRLGHRAAFSLLDGQPDSREERTACFVVPEHTRPYDTTLVLRQIGPAIAVDVEPLLAVSARQQAEPPSLAHGR